MPAESTERDALRSMTWAGGRALARHMLAMAGGGAALHGRAAVALALVEHGP